jgi:peptidoglycan/LPS O-acetylase OafA/YrhL
MTTEARDTGSADSPYLRRELRLWEAVGISLALMAPSMAANINPQGTADTGVGRAVPLAFALATIGAAKLLFLSGERQDAAWEVVVPFLALAVIGYTLLRNVYPYPTDAGAWYPIIAALWVIAGILLTFVRYAATQRAGESLMAEEGLAAETGSRTEGSRVPRRKLHVSTLRLMPPLVSNSVC